LRAARIALTVRALEMRQPMAETTQGGAACVDGVKVVENRSAERRRTILALVSASVISVVVWGLVVALHLQ
jgi:hypothetical protein